jgi:hypothetical protein
MPHVTLYKPNGQLVISTDVKGYTRSNNVFEMALQGAAAEDYGATVETTSPYFIGSKSQD